MLKGLTGVVVAVVGVGGVLAAPAGAQQYPPADNGVSVDCTTPAPGETVTVTARTFLPDAGVTVTLEPETVTLGSGTADGEGVLRFDAAIPADTSPGERTITAAGQSSGGLLSLTARITVVPAGETGCAGAPGGASAGAAPAAPAGDSSGRGGSLPLTGSGLTLLLLQIALALAAAGGLFLALSAKRRRTARLAT